MPLQLQYSMRLLNVSITGSVQRLLKDILNITHRPDGVLENTQSTLTMKLRYIFFTPQNAR